MVLEVINYFDDIELIKKQAEKLKQKYKGAVATAPLIITICIAFLYLK